MHLLCLWVAGGPQSSRGQEQDERSHLPAAAPGCELPDPHLLEPSITTPVPNFTYSSYLPTDPSLFIYNA